MSKYSIEDLREFLMGKREDEEEIIEALEEDIELREEARRLMEEMREDYSRVDLLLSVLRGIKLEEIEAYGKGEEVPSMDEKIREGARTLAMMETLEEFRKREPIEEIPPEIEEVHQRIFKKMREEALIRLKCSFLEEGAKIEDTKEGSDIKIKQEGEIDSYTYQDFLQLSFLPSCDDSNTYSLDIKLLGPYEEMDDLDIALEGPDGLEEKRARAGHVRFDKVGSGTHLLQAKVDSMVYMEAELTVKVAGKADSESELVGAGAGAEFERFLSYKGAAFLGTPGRLTPEDFLKKIKITREGEQIEIDLTGVGEIMQKVQKVECSIAGETSLLPFRGKKKRCYIFGCRQEGKPEVEDIGLNEEGTAIRVVIRLLKGTINL